MNTKQIRSTIDEAVAEEPYLWRLEDRFHWQGMLTSLELTYLDRQYYAAYSLALIEFVPEILDVLSDRAEELDVDLQPVLDAVDAYFHESDDVISEDLDNLYGLLDDAYVAIRVVEFLQSFPVFPLGYEFEEALTFLNWAIGDYSDESTIDQLETSVAEVTAVLRDDPALSIAPSDAERPSVPPLPKLETSLGVSPDPLRIAEMETIVNRADQLGTDDLRWHIDTAIVDQGGEPMLADELDLLTTDVVESIKRSPDVLAAVAEGATANGNYDAVHPLLKTVETYFLNPRDVVGVYSESMVVITGHEYPVTYAQLVDDAYLIYRAVQILSETIDLPTVENLDSVVETLYFLVYDSLVDTRTELEQLLEDAIDRPVSDRPDPAGRLGSGDEDSQSPGGSTPPTSALCITCNGAGRSQCGACSGRGSVTTTELRPGWDGSPAWFEVELTCSICSGAGQVTCGMCGGTGRITLNT